MQGLLDFFRRNPQALVLLVICVVLGLGTFIAVLIALGGSSQKGPGYPSGVVAASHSLLTVFLR